LVVKCNLGRKIKGVKICYKKSTRMSDSDNRYTSSEGEAQNMNSESSRGGWRSFPFVIGLSLLLFSFGCEH